MRSESLPQDPAPFRWVNIRERLRERPLVPPRILGAVLPLAVDLLAEDVVFDYIITTPGYPRHVEGRLAVADLYRPYGDTIVLDRCDDLAVHHDPKTGVVVLEYSCQGRIVATGAPYANRYISVLTITDRKVSRWRDYLDPVAVFNALGWPSP